MMVAGVMSGTSADGINVALVRLSGGGQRIRLKLLAHRRFAYPAPVRQQILALMNGRALVADLARLNFLLGELYAEAVLKTLRSARMPKLDLVGCHGQTLFHQGEPTSFLARKIACTWQTGEAAVIAARTGVPVVSDFRPADLTVGGQGAPLVPFLDYMLFRHPRRGRIVQNLGGIGNLTAIPAGAKSGDVLAFDTGPANMVIDAVTEKLFGLPFDRGGKLAARGRVLEDVVSKFLRAPFFRKSPQRSAGREQFGREFAVKFIQSCKQSSQFAGNKVDIVATATAFTAASIADSLARFVLERNHRYRDFIAAGGGTSNQALMNMLAAHLAPFELKLQTSTQLGLPSEAKEAAAFALLAYLTWRRQPGNLPSATGARRPAVLGKISFP